MTRETKIGLLVGLAFIIVIGILLSDHMTSTTQPPQAALAETARTVGSSVTAPAPTNPQPAPIGQTPPITPSNPVPTRVELHPPTTPVAQHGASPITQIGIGGPAAPPQQPQSPIAIRQTEPPIVPQPPQAPEGTQSLDNRTLVQTNPPVPQPQAKKEYVAQAGDNLSKLATKMLGSNSKANRDAIVKANPSLQKNPDLIVEGRGYVIPQLSATPGAAPAPTPPSVASNGNTTEIPETIPVDAHGRPIRSPIPVTELVDNVPSPAPATGQSVYVVKEKDTLWKIAKEQLGSGSPAAIQQIKDLNKDQLKGGDIVQPNMRLKIPAKSLASAR